MGDDSPLIKSTSSGSPNVQQSPPVQSSVVTSTFNGRQCSTNDRTPRSDSISHVARECIAMYKEDQKELQKKLKGLSDNEKKYENNMKESSGKTGLLAYASRRLNIYLLNSVRKEIASVKTSLQKVSQRISNLMNKLNLVPAEAKPAQKPVEIAEDEERDRQIDELRKDLLKATSQQPKHRPFANRPPLRQKTNPTKEIPSHGHGSGPSGNSHNVTEPRQSNKVNPPIPDKTTIKAGKPPKIVSVYISLKDLADPKSLDKYNQILKEKTTELKNIKTEHAKKHEFNPTRILSSYKIESLTAEVEKINKKLGIGYKKVGDLAIPHLRQKTASTPTPRQLSAPIQSRVDSSKPPTTSSQPLTQNPSATKPSANMRQPSSGAGPESLETQAAKARNQKVAQLKVNLKKAIKDSSPPNTTPADSGLKPAAPRRMKQKDWKAPGLSSRARNPTQKPIFKTETPG